MYIKNTNIYDISIIRLVIEYIFIINLFGDINVNITINLVKLESV
jgi:hypothetical protein